LHLKELNNEEEGRKASFSKKEEELLFVYLDFKSNQHSKGHITTFQLYKWRNTSDAHSCIIPGKIRHLSTTINKHLVS
jgi:hypothetical protein